MQLRSLRYSQLLDQMYVMDNLALCKYGFLSKHVFVLIVNPLLARICSFLINIIAWMPENKYSGNIVEGFKLYNIVCYYYRSAWLLPWILFYWDLYRIARWCILDLNILRLSLNCCMTVWFVLDLGLLNAYKSRLAKANNASLPVDGRTSPRKLIHTQNYPWG